MKTTTELKNLYLKLYGKSAQPHLDALLALMNVAKSNRHPELQRMDTQETDWYFSSSMVGMTLYVDLFAGDLKGLAQKVDYFRDLGITYLHLMPLLKPRPGENDG